MEQKPTSLQVTLYAFQSKPNDPEHKVQTTAVFEEDNLLVSEYMEGAYVRQHVGQHDFTYKAKLNPSATARVAELLGAAPADKQDLLQKIAGRFTGEHAYGIFTKFLEDNAIEYDSGEAPISWF